ncbi:MAG: polysaccharide biosynthesis/export family protein [Gammaproteobacteria bacterium]|nr:polysaccharide biosynthesis/export family protein [Gammaproteobacteria bacterium]
MTGIVFFLLAVTASGDNLAYRLYAGDAITVSVYSRPDLSGTFRLDERGRVILPLIGPLNVSGRTTDEIGASITELLQAHVDGNIAVITDLAEYRPVYIDGDIARPGVYAYRPGMTVAIAVSLAGGRHSLRASGTLLNLSQEEEQFSMLLDNHRANVAREARLLAELAGKQKILFPGDLEAAAENSERVREILNNERAIMASRTRLRALQAASLEKSIEGLEQVIHELESQKGSINSRRILYEKQFRDIELLVNKGVVPKVNLLRLQINATTLDQEARTADITIIRTRQTLDENRVKLANLPVERNATITASLQTVQDSLAKSRIQFDQSLRRLALLNSQIPPQADPDVPQPSPRIVISRAAKSVAQPPVRLDAAWGTLVLPGDLIHIPYPEFSAPNALDGGLPGRLQSPAE